MGHPELSFFAACDVGPATKLQSKKPQKSAQKTDAGGDDHKGCNRRPASGRPWTSWFPRVLTELRREPRQLNPGTVIHSFSSRGFVLQGPVNLNFFFYAGRMFDSRVLQFRWFAAAEKSCSLRCVKAPSWVHYQELQRPRKQSGLSIPEPGIRAGGEPLVRPGYSDGCEASFRSREGPGHVPTLWAAPNKERNPDRRHCNTPRRSRCCFCKVPAYPAPLSLSTVGTVAPFDCGWTFPITGCISAVGGTA